jgi:hypothetical protein
MSVSQTSGTWKRFGTPSNELLKRQLFKFVLDVLKRELKELPFTQLGVRTRQDANTLETLLQSVQTPPPYLSELNSLIQQLSKGCTSLDYFMPDYFFHNQDKNIRNVLACISEIAALEGTDHLSPLPVPLYEKRFHDLWGEVLSRWGSFADMWSQSMKLILAQQEDASYTLRIGQLLSRSAPESFWILLWRLPLDPPIPNTLLTHFITHVAPSLDVLQNQEQLHACLKGYFRIQVYFQIQEFSRPNHMAKKMVKSLNLARIIERISQTGQYSYNRVCM